MKVVLEGGPAKAAFKEGTVALREGKVATGAAKEVVVQHQMLSLVQWTALLPHLPRPECRWLRGAVAVPHIRVHRVHYVTD